MAKCNTGVRGAPSRSVIPGVEITMLMANACANHHGAHIIVPAFISWGLVSIAHIL